MNKYEAYIQKVLKTEKVILGTELNLELQNTFSISSTLARKVIQRAVFAGTIKSSSPTTFGNNQFTYLLNGQALTKEMVVDITKANRPPLFRVLISLDLNGGIISKYEVQKLAATPVMGGKTKSDSLQKIVSDLTKLELVREVKHQTGMEFLIYPHVFENSEELMAKEIGKMSLDATFIPDIIRTLQKFNIIDSKNYIYRNKNHPDFGIIHNNYKWDAIAYTRTTGINANTASKANTSEKQTLVVIDIVVSRPYNMHDVNGFLARIQSVLNSVTQGKRKVLPIVVYAEIEDDQTLNTLHKLGFLSFDLGSIFGSKIYSVLKNFKTLKQAQDGKVFEIKDTEKLIEETLLTMRDAGQEDNLNTLKGDLFEFLMYPVLSVLCPQAGIKQGEKLRKTDNGKKEEYEYDYIIDSFRLSEIIIVELKGYASSSYISLGNSETKNSLGWFFMKTLPFAIKQLKSSYKSNYKFSGCYITTSGFKADGIDFLSKINNGKLKPKELDCWYDGSKLLDLLKTKELKKSKEIIEKYYIKKAP